MLDEPLRPHGIDHRTSPSLAAAKVGSYSYSAAGKRLLDLLLVLLVGPFFLPIIAVLAILVRLDGGPAFYLQPRVGRGGNTFMLWKLRTMVPNAEAALEGYIAGNAAARSEWNATQKLRHDPRLTAIGPYLRRYSLDELPQLWNVLIGDMSLVGPRPMLTSQRPLYPGTAYYDLRPGLTGLWQISERNNCTFAERATYDSRYATSLTIFTDMGILLRTVGVVFRGTGC